jgi:hypothetical protein
LQINGLARAAVENLKSCSFLRREEQTHERFAPRTSRQFAGQVPEIVDRPKTAAVGNPGGRPKSVPNGEVDLRSHAWPPAPIELYRAFDLPAKSNFATVIATALFYRAVYKTPAVKFLVQLTEGPVRLASGKRII